jgi:hypothetical protein
MADFTHSGYLKLLADIKALGRQFVSFNNIPDGLDSYVILRHDIDFSLSRALDIAKLDYEAGVSSTFFILLTAPYYNPLSDDGLQYIREIAALGHQLGLHYDCTGFELLTEAQRLHRVKIRAEMLEEVLGIPIQTIAQHKPAKSMIRQTFPDFIDAYSPQFFTDIAYISDSRRMFRHADVLGFFRDNPKSQLLIHPIWWNKTDMSRAEIVQSLLTSHTGSISAHLDEELRAIESYLEINKG